MPNPQPSPWTAPPPAAPPATVSPGAPPVSIGTLVSRTFSTWSQNLLPFAIVAVAVQIPILLVSWALGSPFLGARPFGAQSVEAQEFVFGARYWAMTLATSLLALVQMGALTAGAVLHLGGQRASPGEMLASGLRRTGPILVSGVLALLATYLGLILLVVPGVIVALMFSLAVPVLMAEPVGPVKALGRSRALTKGHRTKIFVVVLVSYLAGAAPGLLLASLFTGATQILLSVVVNAVMGPIVLVAPAVAYHDLRTSKEGASTAELVKVFE